jgi:nicotinamide-nucleotide amidase
MKAEIITIGTELLLGRHFDENSLILAEGLSRLGILLHYKSVVGDREEDLEEALRSALDRSQLILTTGGLGPTIDDLTRKVVSRVMKRRLVFREELVPEILKKASRGSARPPKSLERQALFPSRSVIVPNPLGTAPGFLISEGGKIIVSLPGVPREMRRMFEETVGPYLSRSVKTAQTLLMRRLLTTGLAESAVDERLRDLFRPRKKATLGLSARPTGVDVLVWVRAGSADEGIRILDEVEDAVRERLGSVVYGVDQQTLEEIVGGLLQKSKLTLSVAESCTGGLLTHRLTNIPGSSTFFERGIVCYSNSSKSEWLGVPQEVLEKHGAVSAETARIMAEEIRSRARTDIGLAITGIAGPTGGSAEKPVGLVYTALSHASGLEEKAFQFKGEREAVKAQAAQTALDVLRRHLLKT